MMTNKNRLLNWLIPTITIVTAIIFVVKNGEYSFYIFKGDQRSYFESAQLFYQNFSAHSFRAIGYALFLGLPEIFGMVAPYGYWPIVLNCLFFMGIIWVVNKFQKELNLPVLLFVGVGLVLSLGFIKGMSFALTETGFAFFIVLATFKLYQFLQSYNTSAVFWFFLALGFASLFRPGLYLLTLMIVPVYILFLLLRKKGSFILYFMAILPLLLTLGTQSLLMKKTFGTYRLTYIDDITWYRYGGALATTIHNENCISNTCFKEEQAKRDRFIDTMSNDEMSIIAKADRKDVLTNKTAAFYKMMKVNISTNLLSGAVRAEENKLLNLWTVFNNLFLSLFPFGLYGFVFLFGKFRKKFSFELHLVCLFMLAVIAYTILTSGISAYQGDRFHIAFYPLSLLLISVILTKLYNPKNA